MKTSRGASPGSSAPLGMIDAHCQSNDFMVLAHETYTTASLNGSGLVLAETVLITGRTTAVALPPLLIAVSPPQHRALAAACRLRGRKSSPFSSGNYNSSCYNKILSVIKFQSEQPHFLICRDFISLWECLLSLL